MGLAAQYGRPVLTQDTYKMGEGSLRYRLGGALEPRNAEDPNQALQADLHAIARSVFTALA